MNKVKLILEQKGWSISDLMRKSGLAMGTCHAAATVKDWPTEGVNWGTIEIIAHTLGVSPGELINHSEATP